jgi:hypothetical protein
MSATATANGKARRTLAEQLDRLDGILDTLSEGLNEAVSDAVRQGTRSAVRDAIVEVLTNPELRVLLGGVLPQPPAVEPTPPAPTSVQPTLLTRAAEAVKGVALGVARRIAAAAQAIREAPKAALELARPLGLVWRLKRILLIALGVGMAAAAMSFMGSHTVAAVISGVGGAVSAVAVQASLWTRRLLRLRVS